MWQRIQTVFLVIAIAALLSSLILPIWSVGAHKEQSILTSFYFLKDGVYQYNPYTLTAMFAIAAVTLAIIEITKYKNRNTQMKIGALNSLFMAGTILCSFIFSNQLMKTLESGGGQYGLGLWLPGIAVLCNLLANRFIRKDEKLVRDSDRLR